MSYARAYVRGLARRTGKLRHLFFAGTVAAVSLLSLVLFLYNFYWSSGSQQARHAVNAFYAYEQAGDYGSAWELLHPAMRAQFSKEYYIRLRTSFYMQQLGAGSFRFETGEPKRLDYWKHAPEAERLAGVYRIPVTQHLMTVFGQMTIKQDIHAVKEEDRWLLLWNYNEEERTGDP